MDTSVQKLWNQLITHETKKGFLCQTGSQISQEDFNACLQKMLNENGIPATSIIQKVEWEGGGKILDKILINCSDDNPELTPLCYVVGIDRLGNFTFVEEKVCFLPPVLPPMPRKLREAKDPGNNPSMLWILGLLLIGIGVIAAASAGDGSDGAFGFMFCLGTPGLILLLWGLSASSSWQEKSQRWQEAQSWNETVREEQSDWDGAWKKWKGNVIRTLKASESDDIVGRYLAALTETVKQVIKSLFEDRNAELKEKTEKTKTQKEVEEAINARMKEAL